MDLQLIDGKVTWVKIDGSIANKPVSTLAEIKYLGFPLLVERTVKSARLLLGDPYSDTKLIVILSSSNWVGSYLVDKNSQQTKRLSRYTKELIQDGKLNLNNTEDYPYKSGIELKIENSEELSPESLSQESGMDVVQDCRNGYRLWIKGEYKYIRGIPDSWSFLPKGDASMTRTVKQKGPHWNIFMLNNDHYEQPGIFAPTENIEVVFEYLGGEAGQAKRLKKKEEWMKSQEEKLDQDFRSGIQGQYPGIPEVVLEEVVSRARSRGCVGRAAFIYFATSDAKEDTINLAAELAVKAHVRHKYTSYEDLLSNGQDREIAREQILGQLHTKLNSWR